ncbi:MAG: ABC transporter substrate-binding protein [Lachnospiraceae bacterium]|jgi:sulfonate transport system substrate-binding protein|nr:ABC transporter substrate-binding protein [Lachnospiraceae bacterium]
MKSRRSKIAAAFLSIAVLLAIAGCSDTSADTPASAANAAVQTDSSATTGNAATTDAAAPADTTPANPYEGESLKTVKLAAGAIWYVAEEKGYFEEVFNKYGIEVELVQGTIGQEAQLMERGDLHVASRMLYPYLLYRAQGADMIAFQTSKHPHPKITSIFVNKDSEIQSFEELKGKSIAAWVAGCPYMVLIELTESYGWQASDWEFINVAGSSLKDTLLSGEVDAVCHHQVEGFAPLVVNGDVREIEYTLADGLYVNGGGATVLFGPTETISSNPKIFTAVRDLNDEIQKWILANPDEAAAIVESVDRSPVEVSLFGWETDRSASTWGMELDLEKIKKETEATQQWMVEYGQIAQATSVDTLFDPQFYN